MDTDPTLIQRIEARRFQLAIYRAAYAETYGRQLDAASLEARDPVLRELRGEELTQGHRVAIDYEALPEDSTGVLLSTFDGWAQVKLERGGAIYQLPTSALRVLS